MISDKAVEAAAQAWVRAFDPEHKDFDDAPTRHERNAIRAALTAALPLLLDREEIARVIRETVKADATGLAPAVIGYHLYGFEDAADRIIANITGADDE